MTSAQGRKGLKHENETVTYLQAEGFTGAERRRLHGKEDRGDIVGIPWLAIECKNHKRHEIARWIDEAEEEAGNAHALTGIAWIRRRGTDRSRDIIAMTARQFMQLARAVEDLPPAGDQ